MIYIVYSLLLLVCALAFDFRNQIIKTSREWHWYLVSLVLVVLMIGLRYNIGGDTIVYSSNYSSFSKLGDPNLLSSSRYQPGWIILEALFRTLTSNFVFLQFFVAIFVNIIIYYFIWKNSDHPFVCLVALVIINFFEFETEILRESVAVSLGLLMFMKFQKGKILSAVIFLIMAFSIHVSAAVLVVVLALSKIPLNKVSFLASVLFILVIAIAFQYNPEWSTYLNFIAYRDDQLVEGYFENFEVKEMNLNGQIVHLFKFLFLPSLFLFFAAKKGHRHYSLIIFGYMLFGALSNYTNAFLRLSNYFAPFYWLVIADSLYYMSIHVIRKSKVLVMAVVILLLGFFYESRLFYEDLSNSQNSYVYERYFPYKSVLEPENSYDNAAFK